MDRSRATGCLLRGRWHGAKLLFGIINCERKRKQRVRPVVELQRSPVSRAGPNVMIGSAQLSPGHMPKAGLAYMWLILKG